MKRLTKLYFEGAIYPHPDHIERLAKYRRGKIFFDGKQAEILTRASELLKETPHADKLEKLHIAVNIIDALVTKPADLMFGEPPTYYVDAGEDSPEQRAVNRLVESNQLNKIGHELVTADGYRGDAFIKVYYDYRQDFSELKQLGLVEDLNQYLKQLKIEPEAIIEPIDPMFVFPETVPHNRKKYRAITIAYVEYINASTGLEEDLNEPQNLFKSALEVLQADLFGKDVGEIPFLVVERHVPGFIIYERYRLYEHGVDTTYDVNIPLFRVGEQVPTGREQDIVPTGLNYIPIFHIPYKSVDTDWKGISLVEKLESLLAALNERLTQIDYILWKHADPNAYGPPQAAEAIRLGGRYIPVDEGEVVPGYMEWNSQLEAAFKELDKILGLIYQIAETPQWLFGTTVAEDGGGTGTSHTDGAAIKARFMPILSKVKRIRVHVDQAFRDALFAAMELEQFAVQQFNASIEPYTPTRPKIKWKDGIPANELEQAQIMAIRTGNKQTIDQLTAIKYLEEMDDEQAREILNRIEEEDQVSPSVDLTWLQDPQNQQDQQNQDQQTQDQQDLSLLENGGD